MKRILSLLLSAVLLCTCLFALASCGTSLEGTYSGSIDSDVFEEDDVLTVTFGKDNAVSLLLTISAGETYTASGTYKLESEADHGHEVMVFDYTGENMGLLSFFLNTEYVYSLEKVAGKKQLTLSSHGSTGEVITLNEEK